MKRRKKYLSQQYAASKARRLRRIGARATPELSQAFAAGKVTLRQYDLVSRLVPKQQRERIAAINREIEGAEIAARAIDEMLDHSKDGPVRLSEVARSIRAAVQAAGAL